ncbi:MAG: TIGR02996 domain-containing protein [Kofleriaceae bacterium]
MPRYEKGRGARRAIWEIVVDGSTWKITYGRANEPLSTYTRDYHHPSDAESNAETLVAQRIADGYRLVNDEPLPSPPAPRSELEQQLRANPDDEALYLVFADWLQAQGDPRGRLIVVQHQLAIAPTPELAVEERAILATHESALFGPLARFDRELLACKWKLGFLNAVRFAFDDGVPEATAADMVAALCTMTDAAFVEAIALGIPDHDADNLFDYAIEVVVGNAGRLPRIKRLFLGDFQIGDEAEMSWTELGPIGPVFAAYPRLEQLIVQGGSFTLGTIDAPALRDFEVRTGGLGGDCLQSIREARWPALERLVVWFGSSQFGASGTADDVAPIIATAPRLRELGICNAEFTDRACELLVAAPIAAQLEVLDLSRGTLTDAGAAVLARGHFPKLRRLDVSQNLLTAAGIASLHALRVDLATDHQRDPEDERYPAVGE